MTDLPKEATITMTVREYQKAVGDIANKARQEGREIESRIWRETARRMGYNEHDLAENAKALVEMGIIK